MGRGADVQIRIASRTSGDRMRTNIDIDDALLAEAMAATGQRTKRATVEEALRTVVRLRRQRETVADMAGLGWEGDLEASRDGRFP